MWRWWLSVLVTAAAAAVGVYFSKSGGSHGGTGPFSLIATWFVWMVLASPTIFFYRFLILVGERITPRMPLVGALGLVLAGASAPPLLYNLIAASREPRRNFVMRSPDSLDSVAIEEAHDDRDLLQRGVPSCGGECLQLLFTGVAREVIVGDPTAKSPTERRLTREASEPEFYPTAYLLRIERRDTCPAVLRDRSQAHRARFPGGLLITPFDRAGRSPTLEDRVTGLLASGHCLVAEPGTFAQARLRLGWRNFSHVGRGDIPPQPDGQGLLSGYYRFVDERREGVGWTRVAQRMEGTHAVRWTIPFAFAPNELSWFAARPVSDWIINDAGPPAQRWQWAGIRLREPEYIGNERVRALVQAAVALPASAPRDARHMLASTYLRNLRERTPGPDDLNFVSRLIADPRIDPSDLQLLTQLAQRGHGSAFGTMILRRMAAADPGGEEIRQMATLLAAMPREYWSGLLPDLRQLAADPVRAGKAHAAFGLFAVGGAPDAELLLARFRRNWPPISFAQARHPIAESARREKFDRDDRIMAYLQGLCVVPAHRMAIRDTLIDASMQVPLPDHADGSATRVALWQVLADIGVPVQQLAQHRRPSERQRREIARLGTNSARRCPPQPARLGRSTALRPAR